jgi:hypothetical protein
MRSNNFFTTAQTMAPKRASRKQDNHLWFAYTVVLGACRDKRSFEKKNQKINQFPLRENLPAC